MPLQSADPGSRHQSRNSLTSPFVHYLYLPVFQAACEHFPSNCETLDSPWSCIGEHCCFSADVPHHHTMVLSSCVEDFQLGPEQAGDGVGMGEGKVLGVQAEAVELLALGGFGEHCGFFEVDGGNVHFAAVLAGSDHCA